MKNSAHPSPPIPIVAPIATISLDDKDEEHDDLPPNGGLRSWTQVAAGCLAIFITWGFANSFGSFQAYYTTVLSQNQSAISWIGSIQAWLIFSAGCFSGRLLDAGYYTTLVLVGALVQILGIFLTSIATRYWHLILTQGILVGLGGGIIFTPTLALVLTYFSSRRALALGIVTTGNSLGGILYPIIVRELVPRLGFGWTMRLIGFVHLAAFVLAAVSMRSRLPARKSGPVIDWAAFREPAFVFYVGGMCMFCWARYYSFYYIGSFAMSKLGIAYTKAAYLLTLINGAGVPARLVSGLLADRFGPLNVMTPMAASLVIVAFCWLAVTDLKGMYIWTAWYGFAAGGFQGLLSTGLASITKRLDTLGMRLGMCYTAMSFAALTGPPLGGAIQVHSGEYKFAQIWAGSVTISCMMLVAFARMQVSRLAFRRKC